MSSHIFALCLCFCMSFTLFLSGVEALPLRKALHDTTPPFDYPLKITLLPIHSGEARTMVCFHGSGADYRIGKALRTNPAIKAHLVSFNFPDYGWNPNDSKFKKISYGKIQELLPALFVLKQCVVKGHINAIDLYGFSAGGGALVNILSVLNNDKYDLQLKNIGISGQDKEQIRQAVQKGVVILECPLKSIEEVIWKQGSSPQMVSFAQNYKDSDLRPIDSLQKLAGLKLNVILYFQTPDEILSNRDDVQFVQNLQKANKLGKTRFVFSDEGGHSGYHTALWLAYEQFMLMNN